MTLTQCEHCGRLVGPRCRRKTKDGFKVCSKKCQNDFNREAEMSKTPLEQLRKDELESTARVIAAQMDSGQ